MIIDISDILYDVGSSKNYEGDVLIEDFVYQGENIHFKEPFHVKGSVLNGGQVVILNAHLTGEAMFQCGSCMRHYSYLVDYSIDANLKPELDRDDPDIYVFSDDRIDIGDIMLREFILRIPIRRRCSGECKGLCPYCGVNLNENECHCKDENDENIDSRLAVLKDLFANRDREV